MGNADSGNNSAIHWAWIILAVCFVNLFVNYGIRLGYGVVMPEMIRTLGLSRRQAGDIFNAYFLAYICLSLFIGNLTDRLGARKIIPLFGIILGTGTMLMGTADSFSQASLFFTIVGVGLHLTTPHRFLRLQAGQKRRRIIQELLPQRGFGFSAVRIS